MTLGELDEPYLVRLMDRPPSTRLAAPMPLLPA